MHVKRARLTGVRQLIFEEIDVGLDRLAPNAVCAETECTAVSVGTETAAYVGEPPLRPGPIYPRLVGYCNVARVMRVGLGVSGVKPGDRILTHQSHQSGFECDESGILVRIDEELPSEVAVMSYLAQLGLAALQKGSFHAGEWVAVLGLGVIGLATTALAGCLGARVVALGNDASRLAKAAELGADACFASRDRTLRDRIESVTAGKGIDLVITTANSWQAWKTAIEISRFQTKIAVLGFPGRTEGVPRFNPLDSAHFHDKQLTILGAGMLEDSVGTSVSPRLQRNMEMVLTLVRKGRLPLASLITHRVPWHQLESIYGLAASRDKSLIGAVLDWTNQTRKVP